MKPRISSAPNVSPTRYGKRAAALPTPPAASFVEADIGIRLPGRELVALGKHDTERYALPSEHPHEIEVYRHGAWR